MAQRIIVIGAFGGYVVREEGSLEGKDFRSEIELRQYLREKVPESQIGDALRTLNSHAGMARQVTLIAPALNGV